MKADGLGDARKKSKNKNKKKKKRSPKERLKKVMQATSAVSGTRYSLRRPRGEAVPLKPKEKNEKEEGEGTIWKFNSSTVLHGRIFLLLASPFSCLLSQRAVDRCDVGMDGDQR